MAKVRQFFLDKLHWLVVGGVALIVVLFLIFGHTSEDGKYITLDGSDAQITEGTKEWIESANEALYRVMNEDAPTDEAVIKEYADGWEGDEGLGGSTTLDAVISRRRPDGDNDNGNGWQCSKYTAFLATGKKDYSSANPSYGPVNGKNVAEWLVKNFGWKYTDNPVEGAIGSGGFNTLYGHTVEFLYWISDGVAMVNDANYTPLTVSTHPMNTAGWVWVVPGDYTPDPEPTPPSPQPAPAPSPEPAPVANSCDRWTLSWGDTLGEIMKACEGKIEWGNAINLYAQEWVDETTGEDVFSGWVTAPGVGLYAGHTIVRKR